MIRILPDCGGSVRGVFLTHTPTRFGEKIVKTGLFKTFFKEIKRTGADLDAYVSVIYSGRMYLGS